MRRRSFLVLLLFLVALPVGAQRPITYGAAGGASMPRHNSARVDIDVGWHALGTIGWSRPTQRTGARLDVAYNRFTSTDDPGTVADVEPQAISATLNLTYRLARSDSPSAPYAILGGGTYHHRCSGCASSTNPGLNAGVGTKLLVWNTRAFLEARYHRARGGTDFIPITFGLML